MITQLTYLTLAPYLILNSISFAQTHEGSHREGSHHEGSHHEGSHSQKGQNDELEAVTGEVVDLSCYLDHKSKGSGHKKCAVTCAKKGLPMGILTDKNQLYLLLENNDRPEAYQEAIYNASESVTVRGKTYNLNGIQAIQVIEIRYEP